MIFLGITLLIALLVTVTVIFYRSIGKGNLPGNVRLLCEAWNSTSIANRYPHFSGSKELKKNERYRL